MAADLKQVKPTSRPRRLWPRFTLRVALVLMTLLCIGMAFWTHRARQQKRIVDQIRLSGGHVEYDYLTVSPVVLGPTARKLRPLSPVPQWLMHWLGEDFFHTVMSAHIADPDEVRLVDRLWFLRELSARNANDGDIQHLSRLHLIEELSLGNSPNLTDDSMDLIAEMPSLQKLTLDGTNLSATAVASIARSRSLREVHITGCDDGVDERVVEVFRKESRVKRLILVRGTLDLRLLMNSRGPPPQPVMFGYDD